MRLPWTSVPGRDREVGRLASGMQAKPDSITNAIKVNCGRKAASCDRRHGVRTCSVQTLIASLRISPGLAATGSREIQPVSRALFRARDALTGIKRADTANEIQYRPAKSIDIFYRWFAGRERNSTTRLAVVGVTVELNWKFPRFRSSIAGRNCLH